MSARVKIHSSDQPSTYEVCLRPLELSDRILVRRWLSDPYIVQLTFVIPGPGWEDAIPFTEDKADQYFDMLITDSLRKSFAIEVNGEHVGNIGLKNINQILGIAECFIEVGEGVHRGHGVGTAAMAILMDFAFAQLGFKEVRLEVLEYNKAAIRVYQKVGFMHTQRTGWHYDIQHRYWQVLGMTLTKEHWQDQRQCLCLPPSVRLLALV